MRSNLYWVLVDGCENQDGNRNTWNFTTDYFYAADCNSACEGDGFGYGVYFWFDWEFISETQVELVYDMVTDYCGIDNEVLSNSTIDVSFSADGSRLTINGLEYVEGDFNNDW
jgi:hypothetical protein